MIVGLIDAGEDLPDAAAREVLEETGVQTEFISVLAFRHGHRGLFGKSDLFFVVRMRLKPGTDASTLQPQVGVRHELLGVMDGKRARRSLCSVTRVRWSRR